MSVGTRKRKPREAIRGYGIRTRHSRTCRSPQERRCPCEPSFEAWVYNHRLGKKVRKTFHSEGEAAKWRRDLLRKFYDDQPRRDGTLDKAYSLLRKTAQELDAARAVVEGPARLRVRSALDSLYHAEDDLLRALTEMPQ